MNSRRALLVAALGFLQLDVHHAGISTLHAWLDSWAGVGRIVVGMERLGFKMSLRSFAVDDGWVASFHSDPATSPAGFAAAKSPWAAAQRAAWSAVKRLR